MVGSTASIAAIAACTWLVTRRTSVATPEPVIAAVDRKAAKDHFDKAAMTLEKSILRNRKVAVVAGCVGVVAVIAGIAIGAWTTHQGVEAIKDSDYSPTMLIFELVRATGVAALAAAFVWGMLNLARAALDQSTRYEKRFVAGHFLVYVLDMFEREIKEERIQVTEMMSVFKAWNDSVDSAYTNVKFGSKSNQDFALSGSSNGFTLSTGDTKIPAAPDRAPESPGRPGPLGRLLGK